MVFRFLVVVSLSVALTVSEDMKSSESVLAHSSPYAASPYAAAPYHPGPYAPTYNAYAPQYPGYGYGHAAAPHHAPAHHATAHHAPAYGRPHIKESSVHRNPYETHDAYDAIRTQDADLAPHNPYNNPYLAPHAHAAAPHHGQHGQHGYTPYKYDIAQIPECAYTNKHYYNLTFCLQDDYYPTETIQYELDRNRHLVDRLLSDITYQSADNLVDGLTKAEEEGYTYEHYYGNTKHQTYANDYNGYTYSPDYYKQGGYVCPSDIFYGRPKRAINTYGKWKVIVNLPDAFYAKGYGKGYEKYTQTQRLEQCMYPSAPCSYIDNKYYSQCLQKHNFVRLLAYTYEEGLHIDSFKMPISCSCHIQAPGHYGHGYGHQVTPAPYAYHG